LRFFMRTRVGALPQLDSPEEVALVNFNGGELDDGIWYSQHLASELKAHTADSREDKRLFATKRYNIETVIAKNDHLQSRATITFESLIPGERVMKFGLLPNLRVTRVTDQNGQDLHFIQENRKEDGSFYAILDEAPAIGQEHAISIEYVGDKVLVNAGNGSYYVRAREAWYPNLNGFGEKALYDLTFKVPPSNIVVSVGKLEGQSSEAGFAVSHWVTPVPVAVAGFNYGQYKKLDYPDTITHYNISGFYLTDLPDSLKPYENGALGAMSPTAMTKYALDQTRAQMQVCTIFFGKAPYDNVSITEQPDFFFGQSWPNLVYLPISAFIDSTQRWMLFGQINTKFTGFVQEVTPHEVAHQWFGHGVSWASYHDQWLSEGFAEFAAGLFLQQAVGKKWEKDYIDFWERQRVRVLEKNNFGVSPNDAGPLWLGLRLISPRSAQAYQGDTYSKGAYVLLMLRSLMYGDHGDNRDQAFIDMMHDYMATYRDTPASTESFKTIAEKHMTKQMDLQQNGRLDWFFNEWVYGMQVPRYHFKYELQSADGGKVKVHAEVTQSEVDNHFAMFVPVFADFGNGMVRLGQIGMVGNSTRTVDFVLDRQPKKVALNSYKDVLER
jgi:Peptidase family M1 domain